MSYFTKEFYTIEKIKTIFKENLIKIEDRIIGQSGKKSLIIFKKIANGFYIKTSGIIFTEDI